MLSGVPGSQSLNPLPLILTPTHPHYVVCYDILGELNIRGMGAKYLGKRIIQASLRLDLLTLRRGSLLLQLALVLPVEVFF